LLGEIAIPRGSHLTLREKSLNRHPERGIWLGFFCLVATSFSARH
jgi:hypothetical protein